MGFNTDYSLSQCSLTLYQTDTRIPDAKRSEQSKCTFSNQTAKKANDVVCAYFDVQEEWDKKLLKCIFLDDIQFDWFEFNKTNDPPITFGAEIDGNRNIVFNENPEEKYIPIEDITKKLSVSVKSVFGNNNYELTYEQISKERNGDFSIVALYNSNSINRFTECSTNIGFARILEKTSIAKL